MEAIFCWHCLFLWIIVYTCSYLCLCITGLCILVASIISIKSICVHGRLQRYCPFHDSHIVQHVNMAHKAHVLWASKWCSALSTHKSPVHYILDHLMYMYASRALHSLWSHCPYSTQMCLMLCWVLYGQLNQTLMRWNTKYSLPTLSNMHGALCVLLIPNCPCNHIDKWRKEHCYIFYSLTVPYIII